MFMFLIMFMCTVHREQQAYDNKQCNFKQNFEAQSNNKTYNTT